MNRITVEIPEHQAAPIRRGLLAHREALAEEVEYVGREASGERAAGELRELERQLAALDHLLEQLPESSGDQTVTGAREPLRIAACDALVVEIEQLASGAHDYWRHDQTIAELSGHLDTVGGYVELLRKIEPEPADAG